MLTDGMRVVLETGRCPEHWGDAEDGVNLFRAANPRSTSAAPWWAENGEEILATWLEEHPGTRPWGWWKFDALEPRQVVRGTALLRREPAWLVERWRGQFGEPIFETVRPRGAALPLVESEGAYLQRLDLFVLGERAELVEEDFEPEEVNPFHITEEELDQSLRGGPSR